MKAGLIRKIVSGGQMGMDRAALDVALALGVPCGAWPPADVALKTAPSRQCIPCRRPVQ
jgi:hypothetical protein